LRRKRESVKRGTEIIASVDFVVESARVVLEHRHWDRLGAGAAEKRDNYGGGWEMVLGRYADSVA